MRICLDATANNGGGDGDGRNNITHSGKKIENNRGNSSQKVHALLIQPHILLQQTQQVRTLVAEELVNLGQNIGKAVFPNRNDSEKTKEAIKNDTMGTPARFNLSVSSAKIFSKYENTPLSTACTQSEKEKNHRKLSEAQRH